VHDPEHGQAKFLALAEVALALDHGAGLGPEFREDLRQVGVDAFDFFWVNGRPAVVAADAVAAAAEDALELRFRQVDHREAGLHGEPFKKVLPRWVPGRVERWSHASRGDRVFPAENGLR